MPEDFYAALMMRRALPTTTNIKTITAPGIYPVDAGNANAPTTTAGLLIVLPPTTRPTIKFLATDWNVYTLTGGNWQGLGTSATKDVVTSMTDAITGRVPVVGWMGLGGYGTDILLSAANARKPLRNGFYGVQSEPTYGNASLISFGYDSGSQVHIIAKQGGQAPLIGLAGSTPQGAFGNWGKIYTEFQKPSAVDVGALPITGGTLTGLLTISNVTPYIALRATGSDTRRYIMGFNSDGSSSFYVGKANANSESCMLWNYTPGSGIEIAADGKVNINCIGRTSVFNTDGTFAPAAWTNFDARYLIADSASHAGFASNDATRPYMRHRASNAVVELAKKGDAYTKAESNARYVQNVRVGAVGTFKINKDVWNEAPVGAFMTGWYYEGDNPGGDSVHYRPIQINVNGSWRTITA